MLIASILTVYIVTAYSDVSAAHHCLTVVDPSGKIIQFPYMERLTPSKYMCSLTRTENSVSTFQTAGAKP
jgi:hypothetical protein